jgi:glutaminase
MPCAAGRARTFGQRVQLDRPARKRAWHPAQPFINAGAIVVSDILLGNHEPREAIGECCASARAGLRRTIRIDETVAQGELQTGFRNIALANYMRAFGNVRHPVEKVLGLYFHQCAIAMSCRQLAAAGRYLMARGRHPESGRSVVSPAARAASMP